MNKFFSFCVVLTLCFFLTANAQENNCNFSINGNPSTITSGGTVEDILTSQTLSQTTSQTPVAGSVSCNGGSPGFFHSDNSYFRAYTMSAYGITTEFTVSSVKVGVETALGATGTQPITVKLYTSSTVFPAGYPGSLTQIGTTTFNVTDQTITLLDIPITAVVPANAQLVVEVFTPDGQTLQNEFFIGSNSGGQTAPGYMLASSCNITVPTPTSSIGFPNMHIIINVTGEAVTPVELTSFTANANGHSVQLNWATATETNNRGFEIQKKSANGQFSTVGFVNGKGTTTETHNYSFTDKSVSGKYSYRLRQVDLNGVSEYSKIVDVNIAPDRFELGNNYPNPFNPSTKINFNLSVDSKVSLRVFNLLGQEVSSLVNGNLVAGTHEVNFNASNLSTGVYMYKLEATGIDGQSFTSVKKMILNK